MSQSKTFHLPDLGEGLPDATIVEWFVKEGDTIRLDEPLVSMETAKAVVEVPSPVSGKVLKLAGGAGEVIITGAMLAVFEADPNLPQRAESHDTGHSHGGGAHATPAPAPPAAAAAAAAPVQADTGRDDAGTVVGAMQSSNAVHNEQAVSVGGVKAMPAVRALAKKLGVDLARVRASGPDGTVSLAHHYPGGVPAFIAAMNAKAKALGMSHTRYRDPTGLSEGNVSTANDLVKLLRASQQYPLISQFSTTREKTQAFRKPNYTLGFRNTNSLVHKPNWSIQLTKTGFTNAAGHCLVMRTQMAGKPVAFVVLDSFGKLTHMADANRLKKWIETGKITPVAPAALAYKQQKMAQRAAQ